MMVVACDGGAVMVGDGGYGDGGGSGDDGVWRWWAVVVKVMVGGGDYGDGGGSGDDGVWRWWAVVVKVMVAVVVPMMVVASDGGVAADDGGRSPPMAYSSTSCSFTTCFVILQLLSSGNSYANGCYTSIFSFGDSLADTGNLKQIASITNRVFPVLLPPYGENFYNQSTGRCSNGRLIIDFLGNSSRSLFLSGVQLRRSCLVIRLRLRFRILDHIKPGKIANYDVLPCSHVIHTPNNNFKLFLHTNHSSSPSWLSNSMAVSSTFWSFSSFLVIIQLLLSSGGNNLYVNGCYTSIFSFGDSLADTGNLKQLASVTNRVFPVLLPPYGENFYNQSTGRCSNGRLIIDFLAESLGLPLIPPYVIDKESDNVVDLGHGVNFAVAGATALNSSFHEPRGFVNTMTNASLQVQLSWFKQYLQSICDNPSDCRNLIGRSLILMGEIGGNDYNHPILSGKPFSEIELFVPFVIDAIVSAVNELIEMGARTLVVPGNLPMGCLSSYLTTCGSENEEYDKTTGCLVRLNEFAKYHNELLQTKLNQIRELHLDVVVIYADYYNAAMQIYRSPDKFGFTNGVLKACCGAGGPYNFNWSIECGYLNTSLCDQPDTYVSWDGIHLTEAAYKLISTSLFQGPYTTPRFNSLCPSLTSQVSDKLLKEIF
ncbi:hypothetical protein OSB04_008828 [Centaurea solstitialis]|uniref:GDSL esterase/lipase n=1 Tax=Centaurea solstitialis TaxID=347529 RepID=A0AA38TMJ9_9ASTR|nr:hypothetical protein OSB04_008828 [Centaurea solstitialis]